LSNVAFFLLLKTAKPFAILITDCCKLQQ